MLLAAPFIAAGALGTAQLERLDTMLEAFGRGALFRVILIHHPPFAGGTYKRKSLRDADAFAEVVARQGAELVLHGHMHISSLGRLRSPAGPVPVFGVPSASAVAKNHKDPSRYHIYRIAKESAGTWRLSVSIRELTADGSGYMPAGEMVFANGIASAARKLLPETGVQPQCA